MKQKTGRKLLSFLLTLALVIGLMPGMSLTALAADNGKYREYTWNEATKTLSYEDKDIPDNAITLAADSTAWTDDGWYVVPEGGITIGSRIAVTGTANLILRDGATLTASKGITVNSGNTINIYAQSEGTGVLSAGNTSNAAGIGGGGRGSSSGTVNIHGGTISATGGAMSAGIGGALEGSNGAVNIYSGAVTAIGSSSSTAGIGGYSGKSGGTVSVYGGTVRASASATNSAGIGTGGTSDSNCVVSIYGGEVTAYGGSTAGIIGTVTIDGGTVTATCGDVAGNMLSGGSVANGIRGTVTINRGAVSATGGNATGTIQLRNGEVHAANGISGTVTINGGTVTAKGGNATVESRGGRGTAYVKLGFDGSLTLGKGIMLYEGTDNTGAVLDSGTDSSHTYSGDKKQNMYAELPHTHSFTYTGNGGDTIAATCGADDCPLTNQQAKLTIAPSSDGGYGASLSGDTTVFGVTDADIEYSSNGTDWSKTVPSTSGSYQARIVVTDAVDNTKTYTATVSYGVNTITTDKTYTAENDHGTVSVPEAAAANTTVTINTTPAAGYELKTLTVKKSGNATVDVTKDGNKGSFTMPEENVTVSAEFQKIPYTISFAAMSNGTVTASKNGQPVSEQNPANADDSITLTATPDDGFALKNKLQYKQQSNGHMNEADNANDTWTFTMPASNITVYATFEGAPYDVTISNEITGGAVVSSNLENGQANAGSEVWLTVTPATGFDLDSLTVTKTADSSAVSVTKESNTIYKFTMPQAAVTVTATFIGKPVTVTLNTTGDGGTASLLHDDYTAVTNEKPLTKKAGEKFILLVNRDDGYEFNVKYGTGSAVSMTEFTKAQYEDYVTYAKTNNINVPTNTVLVWVTTPGVSENSVALTVNFSKLQTFTILYQPSDSSTTAVWCKFAVNSGVDGKNTDSAQMKSDATMGDGSKVYSLKVTAGFAPNQIAFVTNESALNDATMISGVTESQNTNSWHDIDGGKYLVIGGDAQTVIVAFVADADAMKAYKNNAVDAAKATGGVEYRVAVVAGGNAGTVTAPTNTLTKEGYDFAGWRGFEGAAPNKTEKIYNAGDSISVSENTTLNAVWNLKNSTVTLNLNGGTGNSSVDPVTYGQKLPTLENPTRSGFAFDGWTVSKAVTENGVAFAKGSPFDLDTPITANLSLTARWKHVHSYTCYKISDLGLTGYESYEDYVHVAICGCDDIKLEAHEFDSDGKCACGYGTKQSTEVTLKTSFGQMSGNDYSQKMVGEDRTEKKEQEVTVYAPSSLGASLQFSKWVFTIDNGATWYDLSTSAMVSFVIPCDMQLRALYVNPVTNPQVELSARSYEDQTVVNGQTKKMDNILFQMNYKLPDGYTFVDAGIRLGDNAGISYYELKEKTYTTNAGGKAMLIGAATVTSILSGGINTVELSATDTYYEEHTKSVLTEMSAATLAKYMYESKPINVEKYDPIYWEAKAVTKGMSGSMATLPPLRFAQKDNQNHWIYGIGWLRYKDGSGNIQTIYTDALAATVKSIPGNTVTKTGN